MAENNSQNHMLMAMVSMVAIIGIVLMIMTASGKMSSSYKMQSMPQVEKSSSDSSRSNLAGQAYQEYNGQVYYVSGCTDSDTFPNEPLDYSSAYRLGSLSITYSQKQGDPTSTATLTDYCADAQTVVEYYCLSIPGDAFMIGNTAVRCNTCSNGKCL